MFSVQYLTSTRRHECAFDIDYADLQVAVNAFPNCIATDSSISQHILALTPIHRGPALGSAERTVNFKSDWVARCMVKKLAAAEEAGLWQQIGFFQGNTRWARAMLEWFFEPLAHRYIAGTSGSTGGSWSLVNMVSNEADPPQFVLDQNPSSRVPGDVREFPKVKSEIVEFRSIADLSGCFENNKYYVPEMPDFPLLDAFTVDLNPSNKSAVLWVIQFPSSRLHGGAGDLVVGYQKIRNIVASLKDQLFESEDPPPRKSRKVAVGQNASCSLEPLVQVRYLVVVPKGRSENLQWNLPKGWSENWMRDDHRGDVYCLEIPVALPCSDLPKRPTWWGDTSYYNV